MKCDLERWVQHAIQHKLKFLLLKADVCVCVCVCVRARALRHIQLFAAPGSSAHGISQERILEQFAIPLRGSLQPRD